MKNKTIKKREVRSKRDMWGENGKEQSKQVNNHWNGSTTGPRGKQEVYK